MRPPNIVYSRQCNQARVYPTHTASVDASVAAGRTIFECFLGKPKKLAQSPRCRGDAGVRRFGAAWMYQSGRGAGFSVTFLFVFTCSQPREALGREELSALARAAPLNRALDCVLGPLPLRENGGTCR